MNMFDTHSHLQFKAFDEDRDFVVKRSSQQLAGLITVGTSIYSSKAGLTLAKKVKNFYTSIGVHPHHVSLWDEKTLADLESLIKEEKVIAIGEIGLDSHSYKDYPKPDIKSQAAILHKQINVAIKNKKPILFHCREAYANLFEEISQYKGKITGLMHCYMGDWDQAKKFLNLGLYISFSGNVTYKNNGYIREIAKKAPDDQILSETDSPFLPPEPYRGKRNEPIYVKMVVETIAQVKGWKVDQAASFTFQNAKDLFGISL